MKSDKYHTLTAAETQYDKTLLQRQIDATGRQIDKSAFMPRVITPAVNDGASFTTSSDVVLPV